MAETHGTETIPPVIGTLGNGRFQVRRLAGEKEYEWADAIFIHSNIYASPIWKYVYPNIKEEWGWTGTKTAYWMGSVMKDANRFVMKNCDMTLGVFDTQYKYRRPESEAVGGKLYWDWKDLSRSEEQLQEEMDFPLVHVCAAYDADNSLPQPILDIICKAIPIWPWFSGQFEVEQKKKKLDHESFPGERFLKRAGTNTRNDYAGHGVMKEMAYFYIDLARKNGWNRVEIDCAHPAVAHVWSQPPAPARAEIVGVLDPKDSVAKGDAADDVEKDFAKSQTKLTRIVVFTGL